LSRKPKSKLPAGWDVYSRANQKPIKRGVRAWWKYVPWILLIGGMAGIAFYPWPI
jgi:hypothetical protein